MTLFKILLVEDDPVLNEQLGNMLTQANFYVEQCADGDTAFEWIEKRRYHLILLDIMLPGRDGLSLLNRARKLPRTPVILVSAKGAEEDRIVGLSQGADDYITKPFNRTELLLRIEAVLRRTHADANGDSHQQLNLNGLEIDRIRQTVSVNGFSIELTPIQFKLLWVLATQKGSVLTKAYLYQTVLNRSFSNYDRSLDMHLSRVRRKLTEAGWEGGRLQTVHGKGYVLA